MNPCPCGYLGHPSGRCRCTPDQVDRYRRRLSGPLLDRIDLQMEVAALPESDLLHPVASESSATVRTRVERARARQLERQGCLNSQLGVHQLDRHASPDEEGISVLQHAERRLGWSARAFHRVLKVARTIADLAGAPEIGAAHLREAIQYRRAAPPG